MFSFWQEKLEEHTLSHWNLPKEPKGDPCKLAVKKVRGVDKAKPNACSEAANFRRLEQGDLNLAEYIDKATIP